MDGWMGQGWTAFEAIALERGGLLQRRLDGLLGEWVASNFASHFSAKTASASLAQRALANPIHAMSGAGKSH